MPAPNQLSYSIDPLIPLSELLTLVAKSKSSIYAGIKEGTFPAPIKTGKRSVRWALSSVNDWIESRKAASRKVIA